jgi:hypothetical protein
LAGVIRGPAGDRRLSGQWRKALQRLSRIAQVNRAASHEVSYFQFQLDSCSETDRAKKAAYKGAT